MKIAHATRLLGVSTVFALLAACGGGGSSTTTPTSGSGTPATPAAPATGATPAPATAAPAATGGAPVLGTVSGNLSQVVGTYNIAVTAGQCDAADGEVRLANGGCQVTGVSPTGARTTMVYRDLLTPGNYTLTLSASGAITIAGNGKSISVGCPSGALCTYNSGMYTIVRAAQTGGASAAVDMSMIMFDVSSTPKKILSGDLFLSGNDVTFTSGSNPALSSEVGIVIFASR